MNKFISSQKLFSNVASEIKFFQKLSKSNAFLKKIAPPLLSGFQIISFSSDTSTTNTKELLAATPKKKS